VKSQRSGDDGLTGRGREDYRRFAERCRQAARTASTENERTELLARAETFDFLADHSSSSVVAVQ
jgi:hypothetical protein